MKKRIAWITADYFVDVDIPIVPHLTSEYEVEWYIIQGFDGKISVPEITADCNIYKRRIPYRRRNPKCISFYADIAKQIKKFDPDVIYVDAMEVPYMYPVLDFYLPTAKMVHATHNVASYAGWHNRRLSQMYLSYVFGRHKHFHLFSQHARAEFEAMYSGKYIMYTPLSLKDYGAPTAGVVPAEDKVSFLFFGNVRQNKRLDVMLQAFAKLPDDVQSRVHVSVLGSCDNVPYYQAMIDKLKCSVTFTPNRIADEEVADIFARHHYLVLPYENVTQSGPHMIAYNYGIPVIATRIDGFTEHVTDGVDGFLFEVNDVDSLAEVLMKTVSLSQQEYAMVCENLKKTIAQKYSSESILAEYKRFFETI